MDFNTTNQSQELLPQTYSRKKKLMKDIPQLPSFESDDEETSSGGSPKSGEYYS